MSIPRYPDYKFSGVDWLGEVPSHWKVERFKNVISLRKNTVGDTKGDYKLLSLTLQGIIARDMENPKGKFPAEFDTYQVVEKDDLVFCLFDVEETPRAVGISPFKGMITGAYTVGRAKTGVSPQYLYNYYLSRDQYKALKMYYTGLRNVIRSETFNAIPCPVPPIEEQLTISTFLDYETAKIDSLVIEQEKLINLLKEKRQAVISHAVTRGINPKAKMKNSGSDWLGEVPEDWEIKKLKKVIFKISSGVSVNAIDVPVSDEEIGVLKTSCVYRNKFDSRENKTVVQEEIQRVSCPVKAGTIIVSRMNTPELVGAAGLVERDYPNLYLPDRLWAISLVEAYPKFVYFWCCTNTYRSQVETSCEGTSSSMKNLSQEKFGEFLLALPPELEQKSISNYLTDRMVEFDSLINQAQLAITLLIERRSALISATVTGQIDVRNYKPKEAA